MCINDNSSHTVMDNKENKNAHQANQPHQNNEASTQGDMNQEAPKKKASWQMILTVVAIIAVILIFTLPGDRNPDDSLVGDDTEMVDDNASSTDSGTTDAGTPSGPATTSEIMTPVAVGDEFLYQFNGIEWFLTAEENGSTAVAFKFSEFSRREGSIVAFGNPYSLGQFAGDCNEVSELSVSGNDTPLAFVTCRTDANNGVDIVIFQDAANPARVYVAERSVEDRKAGAFADFFELDITTIVR